MAKLYLIGDPVAHSLSPAMQNAAFAALGLPHRYELLRTPAAYLGDAVARVRGDDVLGANVTIPHKERIGRLLDAVEETARRVGAVNTIFKAPAALQAPAARQRPGALRGEDTDVGGFADALLERGVDVVGRRVLVLGAGGAARACVDHLVRSGAAVTVANRTATRAADLGPVERTAWPVRALDRYEVVVNATSLGLGGEDPLAGVDLQRRLTVVDVVATAQETPFLARARAAGCTTVDGLIMLLHQGARSLRLWTGLEAPLAAMRAALPRRT